MCSGILRNKFEFPARYVFLIWCFFGSILWFIMGINLSIAIVEMVGNNSIRNKKDNVSTAIACPELFPELEKNSSYSRSESHGEFDWNRKTQANVLAAFSYGLLSTRILGGILSNRWSAKWTAGLAMFLGSLLTSLSPVAARWDVNAFIALRVIIGLTQGVMTPSFATMIGRWAPKGERGWMMGTTISGSHVGSIIGLTYSGFLIQSNIWGGWPSAFYVTGILGCVWCVFWFCLIYDTPEEHPRISAVELRYITENKSAEKVSPKIPWTPILTSVPVWAATIAHFGSMWNLYTIFILMPTFLANIFHFSMAENGVLSSLPNVFYILITWLSGYAGDKLSQNGKFFITTIRKTFNSVAFFGSALFMLLTVFAGCQPVVSISLLCTSMAFMGFNSSGLLATFVDMSPRFAGIIIGITGTIGHGTGFLVPYVAGRITANEETLHNWGIVFGTTAGVTFVSGVIYAVFASAELQSWNSLPEDGVPKENIEFLANKKASMDNRTTS